MLRRKLMLNLCPLVILLLITAVAAILLLQGLLRRLDHVNQDAWGVVDEVNRLGTLVTAVEAELYELQPRGSDGRIDRLGAAVADVQNLVRSIGLHDTSRVSEARPVYERIRQRLPDLTRDVAALAAADEDALARQHSAAALAAAIDLRREILPLGTVVREHAQAEQESLSRHFRAIVLGLGVIFLLTINLSIIILVRMAAMILRPVDALVEATRELSREHFDHRVKLAENDEFDELAESYNTLAEHLQTTDARRIEVLGQMALALNHELNNAMATIELQLALLGRRAAGEDPQAERRLRTIHESLTRMKETVQSLKNVRRIVLTDYGPGVKMLDLVQSVGEEQPVPAEPRPRPQVSSST